MRYERAFKEAWTESVPAPLVMTDTEILDWLTEYCDSIRHISAAEDGFGRGGYEVIYDFGERVFHPTLRGSVELAAAYQEANE